MVLTERKQKDKILVIEQEICFKGAIVITVMTSCLRIMTPNIV